jgi:hypothetical protein|tara:strand:+ start:750 stop:911 length:162 start_codon:yes stop_codon:yes gene_type:complete
MFAVSLIAVGAIIYTHVTTVPCPQKYMGSGEIVRYCELDYGAKWILKDEFIKD